MLITITDDVRYGFSSIFSLAPRKLQTENFFSKNFVKFAKCFRFYSHQKLKEASMNLTDVFVTFAKRMRFILISNIRLKDSSKDSNTSKLPSVEFVLFYDFFFVEYPHNEIKIYW